NQIQQFHNQYFGNLTVIEIDGEFFFIGKEVSNLLGYKNGSRDVNRHVDEEDRCIFHNDQNGTLENIPNRGIIIINES
ncbi:BRO family protein, partial [Streptococcus pyogenes]